MLRVKIAVALGALLFLVLAGAEAASAYWSNTVSVSASANVATLSDACKNVTSVVNASFESPVITAAAGWTDVANGSMPGWTSTDPAGIEVWKGGATNPLQIAAPVGNQFVELNANQAGKLSQTISTTPGQILQWSLLHRGRAGVDTMQVTIGATNGTAVAQGNYSDGTTAWGRHSGAYLVPAGQTSTTISLIAISTATGDTTVGNFLDDVSLGSGPCLTATSTVSNVTTPGSVYHVGDVVQYATTVANIGSTPALSSVLTDSLPSTVTYQAGSLKIDGVVETDAAGNDAAEAVGGAVTARLGSGSTTSAGGTIAQGTSTVFIFRAVVAGPVGSVSYTPTVNYANGLAPLWGQSVTAADVPFTITGVPDVKVTATPPTAALVPGGTASSVWTFTVSNIGTASADSVSVALAAGTGYVSGGTPTVGTASCTSPSSTTATCAVGTLAAGASTTITVTGGVTAATAAGSFSIVATATTTSTESSTTNNSATATVTVADIVKPVAGTLSASGTTSVQTTLAWTAGTDNVGVTSYDVYRGGVLLKSGVTGLTYTDTGLTPVTTYLYTIKPVDAAGNTSVAFSNQVSVKTLAAGTVFAANTLYTISNPNSGLCIDTSATPGVNGTSLIANTCASTDPYQAWNFATTLGGATTTAGYYAVVPNVSGTVLGWDVTGLSTAAGTKVQLWSFGGGTNQQWKPVLDTTGGTYHFVNLNSGMCLDVTGSSKTAGATLEQDACTGIAAQSFTLTAK
jgi:uncharacterized repeat protein (TIGR01451 family)